MSSRRCSRSRASGPCANAKHCRSGWECKSGICSGTLCAVPTCADGLRNGTETYTINIVGTGSDGSRLNFHEAFHVTATATGVTLGFDKVNCA